MIKKVIKLMVFKAAWRISMPNPKKQKNIHPEKNSVYSWKRNFLALILKKSLCFLKRKLFLYFLKEKDFPMFIEMEP